MFAHLALLSLLALPASAGATGTAHPYRVDGPPGYWRVSTRVVGPAAQIGHGRITPASVLVYDGDIATFRITPEPGYILVRVNAGGCGGAANDDGSWTTDRIFGDCRITATFARPANDALQREPRGARRND